jgi:hypothetical protein
MLSVAWDLDETLGVLSGDCLSGFVANAALHSCLVDDWTLENAFIF